MFNLYTYEKKLKNLEESERQKKKEKYLNESRQSKYI